jgi:hypothetical protein
MYQRNRTNLLNNNNKNSNNNTNYGIMPTYAAQDEKINGQKRDRWSNSATGVHAKLNHHHQIMPKEAVNFHNVYAIMDEQETNYKGYNNPSLLLPYVPPHPFLYGEDTPQYKKWKDMYHKSNKVRERMLSNHKSTKLRERMLSNHKSNKVRERMLSNHKSTKLREHTLSNHKSNKVRKDILSNHKSTITRGRTLLRNPKKTRTKKKFTPPRKH